ncbi:RNA ligase 1-like [Ciona intestinalis]
MAAYNKHCVQSKIECLFETEVQQLPSNKRFGQNYRVVATKVVSQSAIESDIGHSVATEKLDGTCCFVDSYQGKFVLCARLDRKPNKSTEKKFKKFQNEKREWMMNGGQDKEPNYELKYPDDMKVVPPCWYPAHGVRREGGMVRPDGNGHVPGWVPISSDARQYCWHHNVIMDDRALVLLRNTDGLVVTTLPLSRLAGKTFELIGTNINGNPYGLGSKTSPFHILVQHGSLQITNPPRLDYDVIKDWFSTSGTIEGIVWHCDDGRMFKIHRHHLNLPWPIKKQENCDVIMPLLCQIPVTIDIKQSIVTEETQITKLMKLNQKIFSSVVDILV